MRVDRRLTIDQIAERLAVSRTSVYGWVRDLPFDANTDARSAARRRAWRANSDRARERREAACAEGAADYPALLQEPTFRDFVCLYHAEGYKRNRNAVALGNSDSAIVAVADLWIRRFTCRKITYALQYHADQDPLALSRWWGDALSIAPEVVRLQRKSNSNQLSGRTWRSVHGVLTVSTSDTYFRARLQAWLDLLRDEWL